MSLQTLDLKETSPTLNGDPEVEPSLLSEQGSPESVEGGVPDPNGDDTNYPHHGGSVLALLSVVGCDVRIEAGISPHRGSRD